MNTFALKLSGAKSWHDKGYTGKGVTIAVLDTFEMSDIVRPFDTSLDSTHGLNVCKSALVTAPHANVIMLKWKGKGADKQKCVDWINSNKPDIINVSLGGIYLQARDFEQLEGHTLFCATGNNAKAEPDYPARFDFTLAIGSWNHNLNRIASYSNRGYDVLGLNPYILNSQGNRWSPAGTSFATPFVSGLMACYIQLLKERGQTPTTQQIYDFAKANTNEYGLFVLPEQIPKMEVETLELRKGQILFAVIHHPAKLNEYTAAEVLRVQKAMGYATYAYNTLIEPDGKVVQGRDRKYRGAHTYVEGASDPQYWNDNSLGYCLVHNGEEKPFPDVMYKSLAKELKKDGFSAAQIRLHRELKATACPGKYFNQGKLNAYLEDEWRGSMEKEKDYAGHYFEADIEAVKNLGLMSGRDDYTFEPDKAVTKAELAAIINRLHNKLK